MSEQVVQDRHWSAYKERGSFVLMRLTAFSVRVFGRRLLAPVLYLIVLYFFASARTARRNIRQYQTYLSEWSGNPALKPTPGRVFQQFIAFADNLLDRLDVWRGRLRFEQVQLIDPSGVRPRLLRSRQGGRGEMLVVTHLGNPDVCRAMAELSEQVPLNVLVHNRHVAQFNRLLGEAGDRSMRLIQVSELDTAMMMDLSQRLERGEWLAIAGDRVPLNDGRQVTVDFLGHTAAFPQGPWLMAGLLRCPVNLLCCLKVEGRYRIYLDAFLESAQWERGRRDAAIHEWVQRYADHLAGQCLIAPQQWFNFYAYWQPVELPSHKETADAH
ncbi:glycosyl transferase [Dyella nitratireducens]|uniref:Glycosyl transferase n=1 Tax=Dyella nitratireducens TaxID=1849580 RepID=A0ABQ1G5C6_9GAMM|nr:glycosyl transferase [Dyella nitratireducens]GGA37196.1 glycosyl transferase [Dyella nitratireducens]GLQ41168.1 glycosyl transferase [Dyella nitratireducens]